MSSIALSNSLFVGKLANLTLQHISPPSPPTLRKTYPNYAPHSLPPSSTLHPHPHALLPPSFSLASRACIRMSPSIPCQYFWGEKGRYGCVAGDECRFSHHVKDYKKPPSPRALLSTSRPPLKLASLASLAPRPKAVAPPPQSSSSSSGGTGSIPVKCQHFSAGTCMVRLDEK